MLKNFSDAELLADCESPGESFAIFYHRHVHDIIRFFARRGTQAAQAADLAAETFAAALLSRHRYRQDVGEPKAWLFGIASHKLADSKRRWVREDRARQRLGMQQIPLTASDIDEYEVLRHEYADRMWEAMGQLPEGQRAAIDARVLRELSYEDVAREIGVDVVTARQRVSRGLSRLRTMMEEGL